SLVSSAAAIPPDQPAPTTTTSTLSNFLAICFSSFLMSLIGSQCHRVFIDEIFRFNDIRIRSDGTGILKHFPSRKVLVPAIQRVRDSTFEGHHSMHDNE